MLRNAKTWESESLQRGQTPASEYEQGERDREEPVPQRGNHLFVHNPVWTSPMGGGGGEHGKLANKDFFATKLTNMKGVCNDGTLLYHPGLL